MLEILVLVLFGIIVKDSRDRMKAMREEVRNIGRKA